MPSATDRKRREERVKLFAAALSNIGTVFVVAGVVGPLVLGRFNAIALVLSVAAASAFWLAAQGVLEYVADEPRERTPWSL